MVELFTTDKNNSNRKFFTFNYVADKIFQIKGKVIHSQGINVKNVTRVIRKIEPKTQDNPRCHSALIIEHN